jgi:hypothetical protein
MICYEICKYKLQIYRTDLETSQSESIAVLQHATKAIGRGGGIAPTHS